jgi:hypothetical protein
MQGEGAKQSDEDATKDKYAEDTKNFSARD